MGGELDLNMYKHFKMQRELRALIKPFFCAEVECQKLNLAAQVSPKLSWDSLQKPCSFYVSFNESENDWAVCLMSLFLHNGSHAKNWRLSPAPVQFETPIMLNLCISFYTNGLGPSVNELNSQLIPGIYLNDFQRIFRQTLFSVVVTFWK